MKKKTIKQLTIDESKWGTGQLYLDGSYCALGFACKSLGYSDEDLDWKYLPDELEDAPDWMFKTIPEELLKASMANIENADSLGTDDFENVVPMVNDDNKLPLKEKRARLKALFKFVGIELHFKGGKK